MLIKHFNEFASFWPEAILLVSGHGSIMSANPFYCSMTGVEESTACKQKVYEHMTDSADKISRYLRVCSRSTVPVIGAFTLINSDGGVIECVSRGNVAPPGTFGKSSYVLLRFKRKTFFGSKFNQLNKLLEKTQSSHHKLSEQAALLKNEIAIRKQADKSLRESEEKYRITFNNADVGIAHIGINGSWLKVNQKLSDIVGYTHDELIGLTFQDITYPADLETDLEYVSQLLDNKIQTYTMEKRYIRKDRSIVWINLTVSLVRSISGDPEYFISIVEDISKRKKAEEEKEQLLKDLQEALAHVKILSGMLPICSFCKKIRDDKGYWNQLEEYITDHSDVEFSHGLCTECAQKHYGEYFDKKV